MSFTCLSLCVFFGAASPSASATLPPATTMSTSSAAVFRVAVIVGYNGGEPDPRPPLSFADDDAGRLFVALAPSSERSYLLATFDRDTARLHPELTDLAREPSKASLATALGEAYWLLRQKKAEGRATELVFAFAGHGDVSDSGEGFVVLSDGLLTRSDLETQVIAGSPADTNHIIIDACASYFMVSSRGGGGDNGATPVESKPLTPDLLDALRGTSRVDAAARARTGVFVSTSSAAEVHESAELQGGIFSFLFRSALVGGGDSNGDGQIEYAEAAAFIASSSAALDDPRARLSVHAQAPLQRPHASLIDLSRSGTKHFLAVDTSAPTHLRILDAHGAPYAEIHVAAGDRQQRPLLLALAGSPFYVVQAGTTEAVLVPRAAGAYALSSLTFDASAQRRGSPGVGAAAALFAKAFDESFLTGYLSLSGLPPPRAATPFVLDYAVSGTPPMKIPVDVIGIAGLGISGALALGAGGATIANNVAFEKLQADFETNRSLDPELSLDVEGWRNTATALAVGAVAVAIAGGALYLWSLQLPDGSWEVP